mmetsp:Transcript_13312/g.22611  ORF Transcript_13312/g.22611 Transcript_13312/m.22611 type:complete len:299 (-) Transcript_13312:33-929(-)
MQFMYIVVVIYFSYKVAMLLSDSAIGMALGGVGILLSVYIWFWVMAEMLDIYVLTTSVEMMKNRECVNLVLMRQKFERAKRSFRVYQVLKLIRREMIIEFKKRIPDKEMNMGLKRHITEAFLCCHNPKSKAQLQQENKALIIRNDQVFSLIRLCAGSQCLNREECFLLMKRVHVLQRVESKAAHQNGNSQNVLRQQRNHPMGFIQLKNFIKAIEMVMNDVRLDPYVLTYKFFLTFYSGQEEILIDDLKKFFIKFETYFQPQDIRLFLREVALLQRKDDLIDIKEIASMIRNDIEMMPR